MKCYITLIAASFAGLGTALGGATCQGTAATLEATAKLAATAATKVRKGQVKCELLTDAFDVACNKAITDAAQARAYSAQVRAKRLVDKASQKAAHSLMAEQRFSRLYAPPLPVDAEMACPVTACQVTA